MLYIFTCDATISGMGWSPGAGGTGRGGALQSERGTSGQNIGWHLGWWSYDVLWCPMNVGNRYLLLCHFGLSEAWQFSDSIWLNSCKQWRTVKLFSFDCTRTAQCIPLSNVRIMMALPNMTILIQYNISHWFVQEWCPRINPVVW